MLRSRIIPSLLVSQGALVKTVNFQEPRYVGDPINAVRIFNDKEVDELIIADIQAGITGIGPDFDLLKRISDECHMPVCYVGGVRNEFDVERIVSLGIEKVGFSSSFIEDPATVERSADRVGSQSVVVVLDVKSTPHNNGYEVRQRNGQLVVNRPLVDLVQDAGRFGAGELVINSIDREGTGLGYDLILADQIIDLVGIPLTFLGGAGSLEHISDLLNGREALGAAAGSLFTFKGRHRAVLLNYPSHSVIQQLGK